MDPERGYGRLAAAIVIVLLLVAAFFILYPHHVDVVAEGDGAVTPSGDNTIRFYQELELTIEPGEDCTSYIYVDGVLKESDVKCFTFKVGILDFSRHTIKVVFVPNTPEKDDFKLTVTSEGNGTVTPSGEMMYKEGDIAKIVIAPSEGHMIQSISVDGIQRTPINVLEITMDSDHTVHVVFSPVTSDDIPVVITVDVDIEIVTDTLGYSGDQDFGSVSPIGVVYVKPHGSLTITISLNPGFEMKDVTVDDVSYGAVTEHTITDITKSVSVEISIVKKVQGFVINASAGKGGSITPSGDVKVEKGKDMTFVFKPASGYKISTLMVDEKAVAIKSNSYTFTDVQSEHTITVTFQPIGGGGGGGGGGTTKTLTGITVTQKPTKLTYNLYLGEDIFNPSGMEVTAYFSDSTSRIIPNNSCTIDAPASFTTPGEVTITVSYTYGGVTKSDSFTVTIIEGSTSLTSISILRQPDRTVFPVGQNISLDGMVVRAYLSNGDHMDLGPEDISFSPTSFNTVGNKDVTISYTYRGVMKTCMLNVTIVDESVSLTSISILTQPDSTVFFVGERIDLEGMTVRAQLSNEQYMDLGYDEVSFSPTSFETIGDKVITVSYTYMGVTKTCTLSVSIVERTESRLTVSSEGNGTVTPSGETVYSKGEIASIVMTPSEGNVIQSITVDGNRMDPINVLDIVMDSDHTVHVVFGRVTSGEIPVTITVDVDIEIVTDTLGYSGDLDFGTVSPMGTVYVVPHGSLTVSATLNQGFEIKGISVNGVSQSPQTEFTITDITEPVSVELSIVKKVQGFLIRASAGAGGSIFPSGDVKVEKGKDMTFTFTPASGYKVSTIAVDGRVVTSTSNSYTFTDVQSTHTISVEFQYTGGGGGGGETTKTLSGITVTQKPTKLTYNLSLGEDIFNPSGMEVTAYFSDSTSSMISDGDYDISAPASFTTPGDFTITVSYTYGNVTRSDSFTVTVIDGSASLISISIQTQPNRTVFPVEQEISLGGIEVIASLSDGSHMILGSNEISFSPRSFNTIGEKEVIISYTYRDVTKTCTLTVSIVNDTGFKVTVTDLSGTRVNSSGSVESIDDWTSPIPLSRFSFPMGNIVPGITQVATMEVKNECGAAVHAYIYISDKQDTGLGTFISLKVENNGSVLSQGFVSDISDGQYLDLGVLQSNETKTLEVTLSFPISENDNDAMGKRLSFKLGIFVDIDGGTA